ncbi:Hypothetical protein PHPALM_9585 [Phytophthora palmivora]|uniref:Uncharacterized protein n=1 Tax=Phytophthora palmivora TaxID=4796 RepID=A0A2P4Y6X0_9STRA|nr:Hypothetical protein PHPALM_9585 [Phytophthora palmivora]
MDRTLPLTAAHKSARIWQYTVFSDEKSLIWTALMATSTSGTTSATLHAGTCADKMAVEA